MSTKNTITTAKKTTARDSTVRAVVRPGESVATVQFGAWGPQVVRVLAHSGGGRNDQAYVAVTVGACVTYAYDRAAVASYVAAWTEAAQANRCVRLPEFAPESGHLLHFGEDLTVACNVTAAQRHSVSSSTGPDGRPVMTVTVGAVSVRVHTTSALQSYLSAWTKAATVTSLLQDAGDSQ